MAKCCSKVLTKAICQSLTDIPFEMRDRAKYWLMFIVLIYIISRVVDDLTASSRPKHKYNIGGEKRISLGSRWVNLYLPVIRLDVGKPDIARGDTDTLDITIQAFIPRQSQVFPYLRHTSLINITATNHTSITWLRHQIETFSRYWPFVREYTG